MCGRYGFGNPARFHELGLGVEFPELPARFNVAPTQQVPIVVQAKDGTRRAGLARWGLVPWWAHDPSIGNRMINARGDTIRTKPAFREAFESRRALMPADLFFEWQSIPGMKRRQPWCIRMTDDAPFAFGALWERWRPKGAGKDTEPLISCTVVTTEPNDTMRPIHDRMPVIIPRDSYDTWLDPNTSEAEAFALVAPFEGGMRAYRVGALVNSAANDDEQCIASLTEE